MATLPFQFMSEKLRQAAAGENGKRMAFVVMHSSTMWPVMVHLNLTSSACIAQKRNGTLPPHSNCEVPLYGASLIVEIHEAGRDRRQFVKIKFDGRYVNVCGGSRTCPLDEFLQRVASTEEDFDSECGPRPGKGYITPKK
jgi:hypothetical protein